MLAVVLVNYNGLDDTLKCLASLQEQTEKKFLTIVVDNASSQDPSEIVKKHQNIIFLQSDINGGYTGGNNIGIKYALEKGCDPVILLNNDTVVPKNFVERMLSAFRHNKDFGILGPLIKSMQDPGKTITEGAHYNRPGFDGFFEDQHVPAKRTEPPSVTETDIVNGCCIMVRKEVFERIGLLDETLFQLCEESDFCLRAAENKYKCGIIAEPLVWHKQSGSAGLPGASPFRYYYNPRNMWLLLKKHAGRTKNGRGPVASRLQYLRTIRHMYCSALEKGFHADAEALIDGVTDAWTGKFGLRGERHNGIVRAMVYFWMSLNASLSRVKGKTSKAGR